MAGSELQVMSFYCPGYSLVEEQIPSNGERIMPVNRREEDRVPVVVTKFVVGEELGTNLECPYISLAWWDMTPEDRLKTTNCDALDHMSKGRREELVGDYKVTICPYLFSETTLEP